MSRTSYVTAVDKVLKPMGFMRNGREWSRQVGSIREVVDLQTSQFAGTTANLWSKDLATEELLREAIPWLEPAVMVIFASRIGELMEGRDRWWKNDPNGPDELSRAIEAHAPAFFERRRSLEDQAFQFGRLSPKWTGSRINLALTLCRMGEIEEARRALASLPKTAPEVWKREVESVLAWISRSYPMRAE